MKFSSIMTASAVAALAASSTPGHSAAADYVQQQALEGYKHYREPVSRSQRQVAMDALADVYDASRQPDWDGYGAAAVSHSCYLNAYRLLESIPEGISFPSPGAEPDGQITFEWYRSPHLTLSLSVTAEGDLHYAALLGASRAYGTEPFLDQLPETVFNLIVRLALG